MKSLFLAIAFLISFSVSAQIGYSPEFWRSRQVIEEHNSEKEKVINTPQSVGYEIGENVAIIYRFNKRRLNEAIIFQGLTDAADQSLVDYFDSKLKFNENLNQWRNEYVKVKRTVIDGVAFYEVSPLNSELSTFFTRPPFSTLGVEIGMTRAEIKKLRADLYINDYGNPQYDLTDNVKVWFAFPNNSERCAYINYHTDDEKSSEELKQFFESSSLKFDGEKQMWTLPNVNIVLLDFKTFTAYRIIPKEKE